MCNWRFVPLVEIHQYSPICRNQRLYIFKFVSKILYLRWSAGSFYIYGAKETNLPEGCGVQLNGSGGCTVSFKKSGGLTAAWELAKAIANWP